MARDTPTDAYLYGLGLCVTPATWLDHPRPNFVDDNFNSDPNSHANGCCVLFLNWLHFQLKFSWQQVVGAAAPTLGQTYTHLTGKKNGFKQFDALINAHLPKHTQSRLATDNPFPLYGLNRPVAPTISRPAVS